VVWLGQLLADRERALVTRTCALQVAQIPENAADLKPTGLTRHAPAHTTSRAQFAGPLMAKTCWTDQCRVLKLWREPIQKLWRVAPAFD
jgi:hypothetical protein